MILITNIQCACLVEYRDEIFKITINFSSLLINTIVFYAVACAND